MPWMRLAVLPLASLLLSVGMALAGSPHFVSCAVSSSEPQVCVTGKEAGLGNQPQVVITLFGTAHCQNRGGHDPSAQNKVTFTEDATVPVQNGKALYEICATPIFQPDCSPPMTVVVDSLTLFDDTHDITCTLTAP